MSPCGGDDLGYQFVGAEGRRDGESSPTYGQPAMLTPLQAAFALGVGTETTLLGASFSSTITLGSIILGVITVAIAAWFTIRSNVAKVWREEAEGWKETASHERDRREQMAADHAAALDAEREVRHALKDEIAAVRAQLLLEQSKPDLGQIVTLAEGHYSQAMGAVTQMFEGVVTTQKEMLEVLKRLATRIENGGSK